MPAPPPLVLRGSWNSGASSVAVEQQSGETRHALERRLACMIEASSAQPPVALTANWTTNGVPAPGVTVIQGDGEPLDDLVARLEAGIADLVAQGWTIDPP